MFKSEELVRAIVAASSPEGEEVAFGTHAMTSRCSHLSWVRTPRASTAGCEECLAIGDEWVHLRLCRTCGHVGCCDDSKNRHATRHFHASGHPIITSVEPGETWSWCYEDKILMVLHESTDGMARRGEAPR